VITQASINPPIHQSINPFACGRGSVKIPSRTSRPSRETKSKSITISLVQAQIGADAFTGLGCGGGAGAITIAAHSHTNTERTFSFFLEKAADGAAIDDIGRRDDAGNGHDGAGVGFDGAAKCQSGLPGNGDGELCWLLAPNK
jgi:hypothetical protein